MSTKILVADNDKQSRIFMEDTLCRQGYDVLLAKNGVEAIEKARERPNLIALEVLLPRQGGWEIARQIKRDVTTESIPIVFVTSNQSENDEVLGFELGAVDYFRKPIHKDIFLARMRSILRRHYESPKGSGVFSDVFQFGDLKIDVSNYSVKINGIEIHFTKKEMDLLGLLVNNRGNVIPRSILLNALWGTESGVGDRTLDVHIRNIRDKLGNHQDYIKTIKKVGYKFQNQ